MAAAMAAARRRWQRRWRRRQPSLICSVLDVILCIHESVVIRFLHYVSCMCR
jgi:hypothetical protein